MSLSLASASDERQNQSQSWAVALPHDVGHINDISGEAVWTLSSCKVRHTALLVLLYHE